MSNMTINQIGVGNQLMQILESSDIEPGTQPGYQLCKQLWQFHPLAAKMIERPVRMALSKPRIMHMDCQPKEVLVEAFQREWDRLTITNRIRDTMFIKRVYGAAAIVMGAKDKATTNPVDLWALADEEIYFNQFDPLNLAGSIVTSQNPNAPDFQKPLQYITGGGQPYHPSRSVTVFNGTPIYLAFQPSAFGYTGQSIFQRALYPMKSFIQSMITDQFATQKAGLLIAKQKQAGSIVNRMMQAASGIKREYLQTGMTGNVLSIDLDEDIESLNLNNLDTAMKTARDNIIANIAVASDVPAQILKDEAFAQGGFGEGTEDARAIAQYIDGLRNEMFPLFEFFDKIVMHRAWNVHLFEAIQNEYPELYGDKTYEECFYEWQNQTSFTWGSLIEEPESERVKLDEIKMKGMTEIARTLIPIADPENRARIVQWVTDNLSTMEAMFQSDLVLDIEALAEYEPPEGTIPSESMPAPNGRA